MPESASRPPTVRQAILRRARSLSPSAVELLRGAVVLGGHFDLELLAEVLGANSASVRRDIDEAMAVGLVDDAAPELRIRDDLIREAVYADSPAALLRAAAAELADGDPSAAADLLGRAGATIDSNDGWDAALAADRVTLSGPRRAQAPPGDLSPVWRRRPRLHRCGAR